MVESLNSIVHANNTRFITPTPQIIGANPELKGKIIALMGAGQTAKKLVDYLTAAHIQGAEKFDFTAAPGQVPTPAVRLPDTETHRQLLRKNKITLNEKPYGMTIQADGTVASSQGYKR